MTVFSKKSDILVTCARNTASLLADEIRALGLPVAAEHDFGVETEGTMVDTMTLNLCLRTGQRVLYKITEAEASEPRGLYRSIRALPWEQHIASGEYLTVTSVVNTPSIQDSRFANLTVKDAVVDRLSEHFGKRPDSGPERRGVVVHCYWKHDRVVVYFDTSGEPLSRRGYRLVSVAAPLQESLAASLIKASSWTKDEHFINPMCGSGTFAIEAALMALGRAPGLSRNNFGFMHVTGYRGATWRELRNTVNRRSKSTAGVRIIATDIDESAVDAARKNAAAAGVEQWIEFARCSFEDTTVPEGAGLIMINPEYGKRLGEQQQLESTYRHIGDFLKQKCPGRRAAVFTGNPTLMKHIGLRTKKRMIFFNGPIECRLLLYDLYEGSEKTGRRGVQNGSLSPRANSVVIRRK
jgi:23S rRNA G2445 N2-methylase RlmL